ncbi:MAG: hypothetical protein OXI79_17175 [Gammaproteobacteria bacterium]|nr:hypothetical protein [Gammaproteobacteria bacterium]
MATPLTSLIGECSDQDRGNLGALLESSSDSHESLCEKVRWLYHSKVRSSIRDGAKGGTLKVLELFGKDSELLQPGPDDDPLPTWEQLVEGLARKLKVYDKEADPGAQEHYICDAVIARALAKMDPPRRRDFLSKQFDLGQAISDAPMDGSSANGPLRGMAVLTLANAAGFSLYTGSATALGLLSGGMGVTLPFAAYTGLSSLLGVVTGPLGWAAMGLWLFSRMTGTNWNRLAPFVVYLINLRAKPQPPTGHWTNDGRGR